MLLKNTFLILCLATLMGACVSDSNSPGFEFMPDMYRSPAIEAYVDYGMDPYHFGDSQYDSLNSRMSARKPVDGSIAYAGDQMMFNMPYPYPNTTDGYEAAGAELKSPLETNQMHIEKGKELYEIMCIHCHGEKGKGDGAISTNGHIEGIPSYTDKLKELPVGNIFHSIHYGKGLMGSHASQLSKKERWQITQYVQVLQNGGKMPEFDENGNVMKAEAENSDAAADEDNS